MNAPVYVLPPPLTVHALPEPPTPETNELLRQLIALQQEQLATLKAGQQADQAHRAGQDAGARWRAFLARWDADFPGIGGACKQVLPQLERAYLSLIRDVTDKLLADPEALDDEFALSEFLDRYGMRLGQLGNVIGQLAPLADAAGAAEKG
jgi:hypothetical protein